MARLFHQQQKSDEVPDRPPEPSCDGCGRPVGSDPLYSRYRVCSQCGKHHLLSAHERIALLADADSFKETRGNLRPTDPLEFVDKVPYTERLAEARRKTGLADAVLTGRCRIEGRSVILAVMDFRFLGGSMGSVVGEKIAAACELAVRRRTPLVVVTSSGGARMQEGMLALAQMAKTSAAVERLHSKGVPFIAVMAHPTTGGVFASFGTLADVILAEPGAMIGFAGPRVAKAMHGPDEEAPKTAEFQLEKGQIDAVVPRPQLKATIGELLRLAMSGRWRRATGPGMPAPATEQAHGWAAVEMARLENRPTSMDYLRRIASSFVEIRGDRAVADDPAIRCGLADLDGKPVMVVAQERGHGEDNPSRGGHARPEGYRKAQRAMLLAARWGLPVVTLIDTPGADPSMESEAGGLGGTISRSMALMSSLETPILSVVIGEGGSGGALALAVADRVLIMENAVFSVIAPEGAAAIIYRDPSLAPRVADALKLTSADLMKLGLADAVIPEPDGGAHMDHEGACRLLRRALQEELSRLATEKVERLVDRRYDRWRHVGRTTTAAAEVAGQLVEQVETGFKKGARELSQWGRRVPVRLNADREGTEG